MRLEDEETAMKCMYCQGRMERGTTPFDLHRNGYHLTFDAVGAWVCAQCGEAYFDEAQAAALQEMIERIDEGAKRVLALTESQR
jgi:YgiT-type zinc finger domain-containing protein